LCRAFKPAGVQVNSSLLTISTIAILIPSSFHASFGQELTDAVELPSILAMSRGTSVIILFVYVCYLLCVSVRLASLASGSLVAQLPGAQADHAHCMIASMALAQLFTHAHMYSDEVDPTGKEGRPVWGDRHVLFKPAKSARLPNGATSTNANVEEADEDDEEEEVPAINVISCAGLAFETTMWTAKLITAASSCSSSSPSSSPLRPSSSSIRSSASRLPRLCVPD
jgi:hypothetical protein